VVAELTGRVERVDDSGEVRVILVVSDYGSAWPIESAERCFDADRPSVLW